MDDIFNNFCKTILHQTLQGPLARKRRTCHITKGFRFISSTNPQRLYTEFFYTLYITSFSPFLLSSDIRGEGSIAIVKKFDFNFLMIFDSTSLPQSRNVCVCVCACARACVCVCERERERDRRRS